MAMTVVTSIGIVMIPRNSNEIAKGNYDKVIDNIKKPSMFVVFIGVPMTLGLIVCSDLIIPWFFGDGYDKCKTLIKIMSPLILIIGFSNVFGLQFLIPSGRDKQFTIALIIGAITNLVLNLIFNFWWSIGAAIATIVAEFAVTTSMAIMIRKNLNIFKVLASGWKYYIAGGIMFVAIFFIAKYFSPTVWMTILLAVIGAASYFIALLLLREKILLQILNKIFSFIKRGNENNE